MAQSTAETVNKSDPVPRYLQVRRIIEEAIRTRRYEPGARLPGERELARNLNVSQMTVNKAVLALVQDGWLYREIGNGTFVRNDFQPPVPEVLRIGFVAPVRSDHFLDDHYLGALFRGIQRTVVNEPVTLSLLSAPEEELFERITETDMHGFLVAGLTQRTIPALQRLADNNVRVVVISASWDALAVPFVDSDNYSGTRQAVQELIQLGHRRIAGIFAFLKSSNSQHRLQAFRDTLREYDLPLPEAYLLEFENEDLLADAVAPRVTELLQSEHPPTAFFCGGFDLALQAMRQVQQQGKRIPQDISVIGFDDLASAQLLSPPLSTVRQPLNEIGQCATEKLLSWLRTGTPPRQADVLPTQLVLRESAGAPIADASSVPP